MVSTVPKLFVLLISSLTAFATPPSARSTTRPRTRATKCAHHLSWSAQLPDPFVVDGADPLAILSFVESRVPVEIETRPGALHAAFSSLWSLYRPDISPAQVARLVDAYDFTLPALAAIRAGEGSNGARLTFAWRKFLSTLAPAPARRPLPTVEALVARTGADDLTSAILGELMRDLPNFNLTNPYALDRLFAAFWTERNPGRRYPSFTLPFSPTDVVMLRKGLGTPAHARLRQSWAELVAADTGNAGLDAVARAGVRDLPLVARDARTIQTFMIQHYADEPFEGQRLTSRLFRRLYAEYLPNVAKRLPGAGWPERDRPPLVSADARTIEQRWRSFVAGLTDDVTVIAPPPAVVPVFRSKHLARVPLSIDEVDGDDARSIIGFLINRYRQVDAKAEGALTEYFKRVRAEFGLPPHVGKVLPQDVRSAFYYANAAASERTRLEWRAVLRDLRSR